MSQQLQRILGILDRLMFQRASLRMLSLLGRRMRPVIYRRDGRRLYKGERRRLGTPLPLILVIENDSGLTQELLQTQSAIITPRTTNAGFGIVDGLLKLVDRFVESSSLAGVRRR